ncbi:MAG: hypothetical protein ABI896_06255 [Actinomycetota bacterium]
MSDDMRRRARLFRRARIGVLAFVIAYFFMPYGVQSAIPVWLLFLAALGLEVDFFVGGYLQMRRGRVAAKRALDAGPQQRDLSDLGIWAWWESDPAVAPEVDDARRFRWPYVVEAIAGIALVAAILFYASRPKGWDAVRSENRTRTENILSREASLVAGHPARIGCDAKGEYVGFVQDADGLAFVGGDQAFLTPSICNTLYQLAVKHRVHAFSQTARALAVLGHESWHLRGVRDEGLANCYGFQSGVEIGVDLGLAEKSARAMMREQLATNTSDSGTNVQYRVPSECRDGGEADLHPRSTGFP